MSQPAEEPKMDRNSNRDRLIAACATDKTAASVALRQRLANGSRTRLIEALQKTGI